MEEVEALEMAEQTKSLAISWPTDIGIEPAKIAM